MTVLIAGGTGFIGSALTAHLAREGHDVAILSRRRGAGTLTWEDLEQEGLPRCEAVINLCGAPVMGKRWTPEYKEEIRKSRIEPTKKLVEAIAKSERPPKLFLSASGVSYYPALVDEVWTEQSQVEPDEALLSRVAHEWEAAAQLPKELSTRLAIVRIGVVLGQKGGALPRMLPIFRAGLGGRIGSGYQPFPWIHIEDLVSMMTWIIDQPQARGVFNGVAPTCVSNAQFTKALGKALHRPTFCAVPAFAMRWIMGEQSELVLYGPNVVPEKAIRMGFSFAFERIEEALADLVGES